MIKDKKKVLKYFLAYIFTLISSIVVVVLYLMYFPVNSKIITEKKTINQTKLMEESIEESINNVYDAVVTVESYLNDTKIGTGTGFVYKENGDKAYILTNHHVIDSSNSIDVILSNKEVVKVKLLKLLLWVIVITSK